MPRDPSTHPLDDRIRAQHMFEAARDVATLIAGRRRVDLSSDMPLRRAQVNAIQEIGEAAAKVWPQGRGRVSQVPWPAVVGMRNRLVHGYDEIDFDVVWKVATEEIPTLIDALDAAFVHWALPPPPGD